MDPIRILKDLIALPSVNPMGRAISGPEFLEGRMTEYLVGLFEGLGVPFQRIDVVPASESGACRANVIARLDNPGSKQTILFDAHQDTVPIDGMSIAPFDPLERDGRIYGRGACDDKGGMAAMLCAFARLVETRPARAANVILSCTCDEEAGASGVLDLIKLWRDPARKGSLIERPPDLAFVIEPTELDVVVAHKGATRWKIRTRGRACHSSDPSHGVNAIYRMARVVKLLEDFAQEIHYRVCPHALCGSPSLSVGRIEGGISVNTVPDECTIEIDRRVIPREDASRVMDQVGEFLSKRLDFEFEMLPPWICAPALPDDVNLPWADRLLETVHAVTGRGKRTGVQFGTHASRIAAAGVPSIVFGPGSIAQAHTKDEWIETRQLEQAA
ncbi:MAG TPA: M20 family metallopeptidase, partial [Planctomycetaceae bacterium]|nr:M20 family metallopeptidase [Planctomycetaceae bacterium]